ncbi:MAG: AAA family ATPase, partial [Gemmatimonadetes bacterium]|nr:AAA family ATPase [Gemmatimonadota bacterium]
MIKSIRLVNFKNFADETLRVGPFTVIVGANASGKSNIRDAFRFLCGIGDGFTLAEIIGGKSRSNWEPIRGAANEIIRFGQEKFSIEVEMNLDDGSAHYMIEVGPEIRNPGELQIKKEKLIVESETIFTAHSDDEHLRVRGAWDREQEEIFLQSNRAVLRQLTTPPIPESMSKQAFYELLPKIAEVVFILFEMRFLELSPDRMREPSLPGMDVLGDFGENLPTVLEEICTDPKRLEILTSWIHELTPM